MEKQTINASELLSTILTEPNKASRCFSHYALGIFILAEICVSIQFLTCAPLAVTVMPIF